MIYKKLVLSIILIICIFISFTLTWSIIPKEQESTYDIAVEVGDSTLLNPMPDLNYGKLKPGESATKSLTLKNKFLCFVDVQISSEGTISDWLSFGNASTLEPFSSKKLEITLSVPRDAEYGNYSSEIILNSKRYLTR